jgi:hypothetical protein
VVRQDAQLSPVAAHWLSTARAGSANLGGRCPNQRPAFCWSAFELQPTTSPTCIAKPVTMLAVSSKAMGPRTCRSFNRRKLVINLKTAKALGLDVPISCSLDQMRQAQAATIGLNQGAVPGKTGLKANPVLDPRPTLASQGIDKVARAPGPPARPAIGRGFRAKDRGGTGLGRPCFSRRRPRDRLGIGQAMALGQSEDALPCPPGGRFSRPPTRLWPATIGDAPYGAVSVFADEKSAVMRHRHADRARPNRGIIHDEAGHEVFIFAGRHPIPQARSD